jgi:hypothetical protein
MTTVADAFFAQSDHGRDFAFFNANKVGELPHYRFGMVGYGSVGGVVGCGGTAMTRLLGPHSTFAGVHGTAHDFTGVAGTSVNSIGVYGQKGEDPDRSIPTVLDGAVVGASSISPGVVGWSTGSYGVMGAAPESIAVFGWSRHGVGVYGESQTHPGMIGLSDQYTGVVGTSGNEGPMTFPNFYTTPGVFGTSNQQAGVVGSSNGSYGVYGYSTNAAAVVGQAGPAAYAGVFFGNVAINGDLTVGGSFNLKGCAVPFPDGTHRTLYCMESPEVWFEDFGAAKLERGRAIVKLDADFAKVIKRGDYKVFLTPEAECRGLSVRRKRAASFEVRELMGGKSSVAFSYRIVGRRRDVRRHKRFPKFDMPSFPAAARRAPRKGAPTAARLRAMIARLKKGAPRSRARGAKRAEGLRRA